MSDDITKPNRDLSLLNPMFAKAIQSGIDFWNKNNPKFPAAVFEGFRSFERQDYLYSVGRTISGTPCRHNGVVREIHYCDVHPLGLTLTNAPAGMSWHGYGMACDIVFDSDPVKPGAQWSWDGKLPWLNLVTEFESRGLEAAARWRSFPEWPHFQKTYGLKITDALELRRTGGLPAVWSAIIIKT